MSSPTLHPRKRNQRIERTLLMVVLWFMGSLAIHLMIGAVLYRGASIRAVQREQLFRGEDGENGRSRFGGSTVDFEDAPIRQPAAPPQAATPPPIAPEPTPPPVAPAAAPAQPVLAVRHERPEQTQHRPQTPLTAVTPPVPSTTTPTTTTPVAADPEPIIRDPGPPSSGGARTGSIGEQRSMLPPARRCNDPVAGTWRAHKYNPTGFDWVIFTLRIERDSANHLRGSILSRIWTGFSMDSRPPGRCRGDTRDLDYLIRQPASGELTPTGVVLFHGETWEIERSYCQSAYLEYNLDSFDGSIDQDRQEFQSRNNDGGRDVNAPYVFRRIGCLPGDSLQAPTTGSSTDTDSGTVAP